MRKALILKKYANKRHFLIEDPYKTKSIKFIQRM